MVFIRTDANEIIATGHMMRCITIAQEMLERNIEVIFLISDEQSRLLLDIQGMKYIVLKSKWNNLNTEHEVGMLSKIFAQYLNKDRKDSLFLVDSYYVVNEYFERIRPFVKVAMIDDLSDSAFDVDILINFNAGCNQSVYQSLYADKNVNLLLGAKYMPLRKQFYEIDSLQSDKKEQKRVLLICGGANPQNVLVGFVEKFLDKNYGNTVTLELVVGAYNDKLELFEEFSNQHNNIQIHKNVNNMAQLMKECDVAISAASTVLYECCAMRLPTIFFVVADNQQSDVAAFSKDHTMLFAGDIRTNRECVISKAFDFLTEILFDENKRNEMKVKMSFFVDGFGTKRLVDVLTGEKQ